MPRQKLSTAFTLIAFLMMTTAVWAETNTPASQPNDSFEQYKRTLSDQFKSGPVEKKAPPTPLNTPITSLPNQSKVAPAVEIPHKTDEGTSALSLWDVKAMVNEGVLEPKLRLSSQERGLSGLNIDDVDCRQLNCNDQTLLFRSVSGGAKPLPNNEILGICPNVDLLESDNGLTCRPGKLLTTREDLLARQEQEISALSSEASGQRGLFSPFDNIIKLIKSLVCSDEQVANPLVLPMGKNENVIAFTPAVPEIPTAPTLPEVKISQGESNEHQAPPKDVVKPKNDVVKPKDDVVKPKDDVVKPKDDVVKPKDEKEDVKRGGTRSPELILAVVGRTLLPWVNDKVYKFLNCDNLTLEMVTLKEAQRLQLHPPVAESWRAGSINPATMSCEDFDCDALFVILDHKKRIQGLFTKKAVSAYGNFVDPTKIFTSAAGVRTLARSAKLTTSRGGETVTSKVSVTTDKGRGKYYALVIGIDQYKNINRLENAVNDARSIAATLQNHYAFETRLLLDEKANRDNVMRAINDLRKTLNENDSLLIYYSGHGFYDRNTDTSYWLPVDAELDDTTRWIEARSITDQLKIFASRHILIVADSCFSGTMTREATNSLSKNETRDNYLKKLQEKSSRVLIASGGNEPVADAGGKGHSIFSDVLLRALEMPFASVFTAEELMARHLKESVAGRAEQTPEYRIIRNSGHDGGDFVFVQSETKNLPAN